MANIYASQNIGEIKKKHEFLKFRIGFWLIENSQMAPVEVIAVGHNNYKHGLNFNNSLGIQRQYVLVMYKTKKHLDL